ncbi:hypothetical protein FF2_045937 [Malus domestica]
MTIHFNLHPPVTIHFEHGLGQKFREALGIGINFSMFEDTELLKVADLDICLIVVKAEASHPAHDLDIYPIFAKLIYLNQLEFERRLMIKVNIGPDESVISGCALQRKGVINYQTSFDYSLDEEHSGAHIILQKILEKVGMAAANHI